MVTITVLLPTRFNDGERIPREAFREFEMEMVVLGGYTEYLGKARGEWPDPDDGTVYLDRSRVYEVAVEEAAVTEVIGIIQYIRRRMEQKAIYIKIDGAPHLVE